MAPAIAKISDEAQRVIGTKRLEQAGDADTLHSRLDDLVAVHVLAKSKSKKLGAIACLCFFAALVAVIFFRWWLVSGIFGVAFIISLVQRNYWSQIDFSPNRCDLAKQLVELVARDSDLQTPINLSVDFAKATAERFIMFRKSRMTTGRSYYDANWLTLSGRFADDTEYSISLNEITMVKHRKWKLRPKGTELSLLLAYPEKKYGAVSQLSERLAGAISLPQGARLKAVKLVKNRFRLKVAVPPVLGPSSPVNTFTTAKNYAGQSSPTHNDKICKVITMMLLSAYQVLNLGRTMTRTKVQTQTRDRTENDIVE